MVGREMGSKTNYTVHSLKKEDEFRKKKATVHEISNNIHIGKAQYKLMQLLLNPNNKKRMKCIWQLLLLDKNYDVNENYLYLGYVLNEFRHDLNIKIHHHNNPSKAKCNAI